MKEIIMSSMIPINTTKTFFYLLNPEKQ